MPTTVTYTNLQVMPQYNASGYASIQREDPVNSMAHNFFFYTNRTTVSHGGAVCSLCTTPKSHTFLNFDSTHLLQPFYGEK